MKRSTKTWCIPARVARYTEEVDVVQRAMDSATGICVSTRNMYRNRCEIGYRLPAGTVIQEKG